MPLPISLPLTTDWVRQRSIDDNQILLAVGHSAVVLAPRHFVRVLDLDGRDVHSEVKGEGSAVTLAYTPTNLTPNVRLSRLHISLSFLEISQGRHAPFGVSLYIRYPDVVGINRNQIVEIFHCVGRHRPFLNGFGHPYSQLPNRIALPGSGARKRSQPRKRISSF
jgi:hypothetical protein